MKRTARLAVGCVLLPVLWSACARDPDALADHYTRSGDRFVRLHRDAEAVIQYRNAVRLRPSDERYRRLGDALARLGRTAEARHAQERADSTVDGAPLPRDEASLQAIVAAHPRHVGARLALAGLLLPRGATREAESHLRTALSLAPGHEVALRGLAALALAQGRQMEAEQLLRAAAGVRPSRLASPLALADFLMAGRRWSEAGAVLEAALADPALAGGAAARLAAIADATGAGDTARRQIDELVRTAPSAEAWTLLAQFAYHDGDLTGSLEAANHALALDPAFAPAVALADAIRWRQLSPNVSTR